MSSVSLECLSTSSTTSRWKEGALQKLPLGEMPAQGRRAGLRTAHTFVETLCRENRILCVAEVISTSAFHWWLCDDKPPEPVASQAGSHKTVSRKIKLDINCLGTKLSYKCTTNRQQRNGPSQNRHIRKVSSRWPWDTDESSECKCRQLLT